MFLAGYRAAHVWFSPNAALPPLQLHIRRNPEESSPGKVLPAVRTLKQAKTEFLEAAKLVSQAKLVEAIEAFRGFLHRLLLIVVADAAEAAEVSYKYCNEVVSLTQPGTSLVARTRHKRKRVSGRLNIGSRAPQAGTGAA